ncbi:hypothetical protein [Lentzea sp. NEAU-D7]|uniref:hypothetical protein n=1 Tax=Lentzea sp. NEAU-D7 TaxID=2994667 RepID=UPI00224B3DB0|nr:hypothetical protein [Lentzea sp. NEAU-D7]MCX2951516.1 hypothetical protein [Lentzea sp. NEAU-D7]
MVEDLSLTDYQLGLRARFLAAPVVAPPQPWRPAESPVVAVGGLLGVGFGVDPGGGRDLVLVASSQGLGLLDGVTGERVARDREADLGWPDNDLTCQGIGVLAGRRVPIAGLAGGGLHSGADRWSVDVVSPDWPHDRVLLSSGSLHSGEHGVDWWHIFHSRHSELRAAGFSPSGRTLVVATSSDVTLWTRA